jgi:ribosome-associated toxin RatA of RatAB toxin-antitoxin module
MLEALPEPYVQTARMKGLRQRRVVLIHALRVAINPVITATAMSLPTLIGGEIITSIVLQLPTIGPLLFDALTAQDMYLAATILLIMTVVLVLANFVADLIIGFKMVRERFTSTVTLARPDHIRVVYAEGPLSHLSNHWKFEPHPSGGTLIDFYVDFEFRSKVLQKLIGALFNEAVKRMVGAFETRAGQLYGQALTLPAQPV